MTFGKLETKLEIFWSTQYGHVSHICGLKYRSIVGYVTRGIFRFVPSILIILAFNHEVFVDTAQGDYVKIFWSHESRFYYGLSEQSL